MSDIKGFRRIKWIIGRKLTSMLATDLVACSDLAKEYAFSPSEIRRKGCKIIKNGIDTERFKFIEKSRIDWRNKLNLSDSFVVGAVARFVDFKNHIFMIDVLEELIKIKNESILLLVGSTIENHEEVYEEVKKRIEEKNLQKHVILFGNSSDVPELLNVMDVYLMPSFREGFSIASVEAQSVGLKIVVSDKVSPMMKLTDNWITMSLDDTAEKWAKVIAHCNDNYHRVDCSEIISRQGFSIQMTAKELEEFYLVH